MKTLLIVSIATLILPAICFSGTLNVPSNYLTIQTAIDASVNGDIVMVAPGTYVENIDFKGKAIIVRSQGGADVTMIDGNQAGSVVTFKSKEDKYSVLDGFTVSNGTGTYMELTPGYWEYCGGGIVCHDADPTIIRSKIKKNAADVGGGLFNYHSSPKLIYCEFMGNKSSGGVGGYGGGGMFNYYSSPEMTFCDFIGNFTTSLMVNGGGMHNTHSSPTLACCTFNGNSVGAGAGGGMLNESSSSPTLLYCVFLNNAADLGGGMYNVLSTSPTWSPKLTNCIFAKNLAKDGGGMFNKDACPTLSSCTFSENTADDEGGGIYIWDGSSPSITNSILWNNVAAEGPEIWIGDKYNPSTLSISYSDVKGGQSQVHVGLGCTLNWGNGMMDADPLFADPAIGDFHLTYTSPCREAGNSAAITYAFDFEGDPRIAYGTVDLGADEFHTHLYHMGDATPGGSLVLKFVDTPNTSPVFLWLGSGVLTHPIILPPYGEWYLQFPILLQAPLGSIPGPDGVLALSAVIPPDIPVPLDLPLQAGIGMKLTNLCELKIR